MQLTGANKDSQVSLFSVGDFSKDIQNTGLFRWMEHLNHLSSSIFLCGRRVQFAIIIICNVTVICNSDASVHQNPIMTIIINNDEWEIEVYRYYVSIRRIVWLQYQKSGGGES